MILHRCPYVDGVIVYDYKDKDKGLKRLWAKAKELRKYRFDKIVDFQNSKKSHVLAFLSLPW